MAVKTAQYIFNGQAYNLTYNSTSGKWEATVTAPGKSSYNQSGHKYGGSVTATDEAGNSTTIDQTHSTLGSGLLLRVLEKVAPTLAFNIRQRKRILQMRHRLLNLRLLTMILV